MRRREFYAGCFKRAWRGKLLWAEGIAGLLSLIAVPIAAFWQPEGGVLNWVPLAIFGATFIAVFLVGIATAPYWIYREVADERDGLLLKIERRAEIETALGKLWDLRAEGIKIRNETLTTASEIGDWHSRWRDWRERLLLHAEIVSPNLKGWIENLDQIKQPIIFNPVNKEHELWGRCLTEELARLSCFLTRDVR